MENNNCNEVSFFVDTPKKVDFNSNIQVLFDMPHDVLLSVVLEIPANKQKIVDAINAKGGNVSMNNTVDELKQAILELVPAQPVFQTSGNLNPRWTDLQSKIAENYRTDRPHAWAFSFLGNNQEVSLTGGDYYICSDGHETNQSGTHIFGANLDESKTDNWVIIYTQTPTFVFPADLFVIGSAFYNTSPEQVSFQNTRVVFISQVGSTGNSTMSLPAYFAQNTSISYFTIPDGIADLNIGDYAFSGCSSLIDVQISKTLGNVNLGERSFVNCIALRDIILETEKSIFLGAYAFQGVVVKDIYLKCQSITSTLANFHSANVDNIIIDADSFSFSSTQAPFQNLTAKNVELRVRNSLRFPNTYVFLGSNIQRLFIGNPNDFTGSGLTLTFSATSMPVIELGNGWNWAIDLRTANTQIAESMYQNVNALADRTGQTALTLTFGSGKLNALLSAFPDASSIASGKNWNLA